MQPLAEFLFAENMLDEFGFLRYVYHTSAPRALIHIDYDYESEKEHFVIVDEIDSFAKFSKSEIDEMMERLKAFWIQYKLEILQEVDEEPGTAELKIPDLDDAVTFSIINGTDRPDSTEFALMDKNALVKMSIDGIGFWASIVEMDLKKETIHGIVQSYLDEDGLKTRDPFMAQFCNVWEIKHI
jgi:hypothetical protein